jgi:S-formylglutathione hydrolase
MHSISITLTAILFSIAFFGSMNKAASQTKGTVERIKVYGRSLEGNLAGDAAERDVSIYLPPSYHKDTKRRYPVVYYLHGFTDNDAKVYGLEPHWMSMPEVLDAVFANNPANEMIFVTPNAFTKFSGSMYSNSATVGNWEEYIAHDLVSYIDKNYRTIAQASSRGLAGHSMGGYGSLRIGQKYPDVFSGIYLMSPCCLSPGDNTGPTVEVRSRHESIRSFEELDKADFFTKAAFASAAAWSPNPGNPPFYLDLPYKDGQMQPLITAKWHANQPLVTLDQHIFNIRKLKAIAFDAGADDKGIANSIKVLNKALKGYNIQHFYEEYDGDHINKIAERIGSKVVPFFVENLSFEHLRKGRK